MPEAGCLRFIKKALNKGLFYFGKCSFLGPMAIFVVLIKDEYAHFNFYRCVYGCDFDAGGVADIRPKKTSAVGPGKNHDQWRENDYRGSRQFAVVNAGQ